MSVPSSVSNRAGATVRTRPSPLILVLAVGLLLWIWGGYLTGIDAFPPFIDETIHIQTAEKIVQNQSPLEDAGLGRIFTGWWLVPFQPAASSPLWVARAAVVLAFLPGVASMMAIARLEGGWKAMVLFSLLFGFSAYHLFYLRLVLADPVAASAIALAVYFAYRLKRRRSLLDAVLVGVMLFAAFGAKVSVLPYFGIPIAAAVALHPPGQSRKSNAGWLAVALAVSVGLSALFVAALRLRGLDFLSNSLSLAASGRGPVDLAQILSPQRIASNALFTAETLSVYTGPLALILLLLAVVVLMVGRQFYLPLILFAPVIVIWLNNEQQLRYYPLPMTLLLLCAAIAAAVVIRKWGAPGMAAAIGIIGLWALAQGVPFSHTMITNPAALALPEADRYQYLLSDASGIGLDQVLAVLEEQQAQRVIGSLANCQGLRYAAPAAMRPMIVCPTVRHDGQDRQAIVDLAAANRSAGSFAVLEDSPYLPATVPGRLIETITAGRPALSIYDLSP